MRLRFVPGLLGFAFALAGPAVAAEQAVQIGSSYAMVERPSAARASIILIPGGDGYLAIQPGVGITRLQGNQLVRTRHAYASSGFAVMTVDRDTDLPSAIAYMRQIAQPVTVVATSRGALRIPQALAGRPDGVVITSGMLDSIRGSVSPGTPMLLVHHREDHCSVTSPSSVEPFAASTGARVVWLTGGVERGDPCQPGGHHGFAGLDGRVVGAVAAFARNPR